MSDAIAKLKAEIDQNKNNSYVQVVGEFLLSHLDKHPQDAEKILDKDKTIAKSLDEMRNAASKKKVGNCAMFTPAEGFAIVLKYFGIESTVDITVPAALVDPKPTIAPTLKPKAKSAVDFDVSLDEFL
jgi:hypothetical protein